MSFGNRQSSGLPLEGGTMSGAINMGAQAITNTGDISVDNATGPIIKNLATLSGTPVIQPDQSSSGCGIGESGSNLLLIRSGVDCLTVTGGTHALSSVAILSSDDFIMNGDDADRGGATLTVKLNAISATLSAAGTHAFTAAIPAGATVFGVTTRVTTTITGCTSINIGDGTDADRFGAAIALTAGTTTTNASWTIASTPIYAAATDIVITAVGGGASFTAGAMRVCVYYAAPTAPTS